MIKVKNIKPVFTSIITTTEKYSADSSLNGGVIIDNKKTAGSVKEYQKVVSVGSAVREVKVGDVVLINPTRYMKRKFNDNSLREDIVDNPVIDINIPVVIMNDTEYFLIEERDVAYIIDDYEEVEDSIFQQKLILPRKKEIKL